MDNRVSSLDWSLVQAFLCVAETGSLSAAAREMGSSQPTVGRQIKALEASLGAELFVRQPRGLHPSEVGAALIAPAREMRDAMNDIALRAAGTSVQLEGTVRITASVATAHWHLPHIIAQIRAAEPLIALELVPSDTASNLLYREADIAVRMFRPTQLDLVTKHIGDLEIGVFAAHSYLAQAALPVTLDTFHQHQIVGYDQRLEIIQGCSAFGLDVTREFFKTRCDDNTCYWNLVRAGCGIGFGQTNVGRRDPDLQEIDLDLRIPPLEVWLTAHEAMRQTPRIRRVWDLLSTALENLLKEAPPPPSP